MDLTSPETIKLLREYDAFYLGKPALEELKFILKLLGLTEAQKPKPLVSEYYLRPLDFPLQFIDINVAGSVSHFQKCKKVLKEFGFKDQMEGQNFFCVDLGTFRRPERLTNLKALNLMGATSDEIFEVLKSYTSQIRIRRTSRQGWYYCYPEDGSKESLEILKMQIEENLDIKVIIHVNKKLIMVPQKYILEK